MGEDFDFDKVLSGYSIDSDISGKFSGYDDFLSVCQGRRLGFFFNYLFSGCFLYYLKLILNFFFNLNLLINLIFFIFIFIFIFFFLRFIYVYITVYEKLK